MASKGRGRTVEEVDERVLGLDAAELGDLEDLRGRRRVGQRRERAGDEHARVGSEGLGLEREQLARLLAVARAHRGEERVLVAHEEHGPAVRVAPALLVVEAALAVGHRLEQPHLVDEGQQHDRLPRELLAVEVDGEVGRIEVRDLRGGVGHQVGQALGRGRVRVRVRAKVRGSGRMRVRRVRVRVKVGVRVS